MPISVSRYFPVSVQKKDREKKVKKFGKCFLCNKQMDSYLKLCGICEKSEVGKKFITRWKSKKHA